MRPRPFFIMFIIISISVLDKSFADSNLFLDNDDDLLNMNIDPREGKIKYNSHVGTFITVFITP